ncbi:hypothetical protein AB1E18_013712 [Capra hircus]
MRWKAAGSGEKRALVRLNQGRISRLSRRKAEARHRAGKAAGSGRPSTVFSAEIGHPDQAPSLGDPD